MEQTFNKLIPVSTYDVAGIKKNWRIIYLPTTKKIIITKSYDKAQLARIKTDYEGIILTRTQAPKAFPEVFTDSEISIPTNLPQRTIILKVLPEQYAFCASHGNISAYLRSLIDRERTVSSGSAT